MRIGPSIKNPCAADWDKMKIGVNSRFCGSCEKNVVDFTKKSREEILEYLILNRQTKTCGHFYRHQLDYADEDFMVTVTALAEKQKDPRLSLAILIFGSMVMSGCDSPVPHTNNSSIELLEKDTVEWVDKTQEIDSNMACENKNTGATKNKPQQTTPNLNTIETTLGDTYIEIDAIEGLVTMGDVDFVPKDSIDKPLPFLALETQPEFPGGHDSLQLFIAQNTTYPIKAKKAKEEGKVYVSFIIDREGKVKNPKIVRGISPTLDSVALHTISKLPQWKPGENRGKKVEAEFTIPVNFKLKA